jgi:hypothetical protein
MVKGSWCTMAGIKNGFPVDFRLKKIIKVVVNPGKKTIIKI